MRIKTKSGQVMASDLAPKDVYWLVTTCESCGRRVRASALLRFWESRPHPTVDDAEFMLTVSSGPRKLRNERMPLWTLARDIDDQEARYQLRRQLQCFFGLLDQRHTEASRAARDGAHRSWRP